MRRGGKRSPGRDPLAAAGVQNHAPAEKAEQPFYLTRESLKRRQIDELWKAKRATSPRSLAGVLVSEPVVTEIRKELRRQTGHRTDEDEIERLLRETVIRQDCFG